MALVRGAECFHSIKQSLVLESKTVIKTHILTGDDCMSKLGTEHAVMATDPVHYLVNFDKADTLTEKDAVLAEKNMVRVLARARSTQQLRHLMTLG